MNQAPVFVPRLLHNPFPPCARPNGPDSGVAAPARKAGVWAGGVHVDRAIAPAICLGLVWVGVVGIIFQICRVRGGC